MGKKEKQAVVEESVPQKLYLGTGVITDIESRLVDGSWETVGKIELRRSDDLIEWEYYHDAVKSVSRDYGTALVTVLQAMNAIINQANQDESMFKKKLDESESTSQ